MRTFIVLFFSFSAIQSSFADTIILGCWDGTFNYVASIVVLDETKQEYKISTSWGLNLPDYHVRIPAQSCMSATSKLVECSYTDSLNAIRIMRKDKLISQPWSVFYANTFYFQMRTNDEELDDNAIVLQFNEMNVSLQYALEFSKPLCTTEDHIGNTNPFPHFPKDEKLDN